jgi:ribosome biogenesis GTPase / thiamine phosphate phosphatase
MEASNLTLSELGWTSFFSEQLSAEESRQYCPVRVMAVHRGMVDVQGEAIESSISSVLPASGGPEDRPTVGDWLLVERESQDLVRILDRQNLFKRPQPGDDRRVQLIAANVDTLFIVTSCNQDFSIARIERYLVLAREVQVKPVVVLTKVDLAENPERFLRDVRDLQPDLEVEMINGRDTSSVARLAARCATGQTVALVGSSGVGKSTMINTLRGSDSIATQAVREADGKGRHTTTVREMHRLARGGWLVDTPGMRELQLSDASAGLAEVFDDIEALTLECRFTNCTHGAEPDCAVQAAIADGSLDAPRLERWRRLTAEETVNTGKMTARHTRPSRPGRRN